MGIKELCKKAKGEKMDKVKMFNWTNILIVIFLLIIVLIISILHEQIINVNLENITNTI